MKKFSNLSKAIVIVLGLAGVGTGAAAVAQTVISKGQVSDAVAVSKNKISLEQAIMIAQKTTKGDLVAAEFDQNKYSSGGKYKVKFVENNIEYEVKIDANTGKTLKTEQEKLDQDDMAEYSAMKQAKISLPQAIQIAKQRVNEKIIEAEFELNKGKSVYEVEIAKGAQVHKVVVDSATGSIVSNLLDSSGNDDDHNEKNEHEEKNAQNETAAATKQA